MSEQTWIPCPPADGGRWPTEADSEGRELDVQHADGLRSVKPWDAVKAYNGYDCNKNKIVAWQSLPAPYVPPEPETKEPREFKNVNTILWTDEDDIPSRFEFTHGKGHVREVLPDEQPSEKDRRIYYQDIVYEVCNILDKANTSNRIVCGTVEQPTTEVQDKLREMLADYVSPPAMTTLGEQPARPDMSHVPNVLHVRKSEQPASEPEKPKRQRGVFGTFNGLVKWVQVFDGDLDPDACRELVEWCRVFLNSIPDKDRTAHIHQNEHAYLSDLVAKCRRRDTR